ncbi:MAG: hypothetical protein N4J56_003314 [Chroococcidiopsis sp. SAG 2025]|uniref:transposase n=1 Tax=Chroococcidiopsis sp. SAG 2025 TaxID=171389 RepID=UPI00293736E3|nr:transposase [Chroococcidiopsis sp. SAG 2025]MDV2993660.1 hypothetical protein [Chroococcidiopsis sp. SAG 2025]
MWCEDEAGPFGTAPYPGSNWQPVGKPTRQEHEYIRNGTAKLLTLFHPATGQVRVKGVTSCTNAVLHEWLKQELASVVQSLPTPARLLKPEENQRLWKSWQQGLKVRFTLPHDLPPLRMLLVMDNLVGHKTPQLVLWLCAHGIMPLYTPLGGSWLNMAESIQRILKRRALEGHHPQTAYQIIEWLENFWMEPTTNAVCLGRITSATSRQSASKISLSWWFWCLYASSLLRRTTIAKNNGNTHTK